MGFQRAGAVLALVGCAALGPPARAATPPRGILEGELVQIDPRANRLLVAEAASGDAAVVELGTGAQVYLRGEQPIALSRAPLGSRVRAAYRREGARLVAERIEVFPPALPQRGWGSDRSPRGWAHQREEQRLQRQPG